MFLQQLPVLDTRAMSMHRQQVSSNEASPGVTESADEALKSNETLRSSIGIALTMDAWPAFQHGQGVSSLMTPTASSLPSIRAYIIPRGTLSRRFSWRFGHCQTG